MRGQCVQEKGLGTALKRSLPIEVSTMRFSDIRSGYGTHPDLFQGVIYTFAFTYLEYQTG
jgi:hypothetical protein